MDLTIIQAVLTIVIGCFAVWFKSRQVYERYIAKIQEKAVYLIAKAEEEYTGIKAGSQRMDFVVSSLHKLLPDWLRNIITQEMIKDLVQRTFESMDQFAMAQMDRILKEDESQ